MTVQIFLKKEQYVVHQLFLYVSSTFPSLTTNQPNSGSRLPFKNRTRYCGGISEWPVKIKEVPRSFLAAALAVASVSLALFT